MCGGRREVSASLTVSKRGISEGEADVWGERKMCKYEALVRERKMCGGRGRCVGGEAS